MLSFGYICTFLGRNIVDWLPQQPLFLLPFFSRQPISKAGVCRCVQRNGGSLLLPRRQK
jgi:hypothetical protein